MRDSVFGVPPNRQATGSYSDFRIAAIIESIRRIPKGSVQSYGSIYPPAPRLVGRILATTDQELPWHRVVRADGTIPKGRRQRELLLREGVAMRGDRVDIDRSAATGRAPRSRPRP